MSGVIDIPVIETERLIMRGWCQDDLGPLSVLFADPDATRFTGGVKDRVQTWRQIAAYAGHWMLKGFGPFAVTLKPTGETIGYCGPWDPAGKADEPELTYGLATAHHRKGYASEAVRAALRFVYEQLGWRTAISYIDKDNHGSLGVARKLGARLDGQTTLYGVVPAQIWRYPAPVADKAHGGQAA